MTTLAQLTTQTAQMIRTGHLAADPGDRTRAYRRAAELIVDARQQHFAAPDGEPDYTGRTGAYRQWMVHVYQAAGIAGADKTTVASAVRYHTGSVLRERLDADTVQQLGLAAGTPRQRGAASRAERAKLLHAARNPLTTPGDLDPVQAMTAVRNLLAGVTAHTLADLDEDDRARVADLARQARQRLETAASAVGA